MKTLSLLLLVILLNGCASTVQPWERGTLAKREMQWQANTMEGQLQNHIYFSKEGSSGGGGATGGGCGCN